MKLSKFFVYESLLEIGAFGAVIAAAGAFQSGLDPALLIGLGVLLSAGILFVRARRKTLRDGI